MRDHEHGLLQVAQVFLQPLHGVQVEVVGGLVEQQVIGVSEESLGQHDAHFLVVAQLSHQFLVGFLLHAQVLQELSGVAFCLPTVHLGELFLQFGGTVTVFLGHFRLAVERLALLHVLP